jgi:broad specificity phosphatase PhoE
VEQVVLARHGESVFSARGLVNGDLAVSCPLTERGEEEARALGETLAGEPIDLCVTSEFERAQQTADLALAGRDVPRLVLAELDDPRYGVFEGAALDEYREWAWSHGSGEAPSGGESRRELVGRYARGYRLLLRRPELRLLVVAHSLPIAYALGEPRPRMQMVEHASAHRLSAEELRTAVERLEAWLEAPTW